MAADLAVSAVTFAPSLIEVGQHPTGLSYRLSNNGPEGLVDSAVLAEFYLSANTTFGDVDDVKIGQSTASRTIAPGAFVDVALSSSGLSSVTVPLTQPPGDYFVFAKVDHGSGSTLTDPNPSNNVARSASTIRVSNDSIRADLAASALLFTPSLIDVGAHPTGVSYRVSNNGPAAMNSSPVLAEFFLSTDTTFGNAGDVKIGQRSSTNTVAPGAFVDVTLSQAERAALTIPVSQPAGDYYVFVSLNHGAGSALVDTNLNNNRARTAGTIRVSNDAISANLAASALSFAPALIGVGSHPTGVSYQVSNTGPAAMSNSPVLAEFFLSADTNFDEVGDTKIGEVTSTHTIAPGAFASVTLSPAALSLLTVPVTAPAGDYFVFVRVNHGAGSTLSDPDLSNNQARTAGTIRVSNDSVQSDLSVSLLGFAPSVVELGTHPTAVFYRLTNNGPAAIVNGQMRAEFFLSADTIFGNADDVEIGQQISTQTIAPGFFNDVVLSPAELASLTIPTGLPVGFYNLFVRVVHGVGSTLVDPNVGNNVVRAAGKIQVFGSDNAADTIGVYVPQTGAFLLNDSNATKNADLAFIYGAPNWVPLVDDWDGDGIDTVGAYVPSSGVFLLNNSNATKNADLAFIYGAPNWVPLVGDWDGDGIDTVGAYVPQTGIFLLNNSNATKNADLTFLYGASNWVPVVGDWDGDGIDTVGVYVPQTGAFLLNNSNATKNADIAFIYGAPNWTPLAGDWNGDGIDTVGAYVPQTGAFLLNNSNATKDADLAFIYGAPNWVPLVGDWDGSATAQAVRAASPATNLAVAPAMLQPADLAPVMSAAAADWEAVGLTTYQLQTLQKAELVITDLPGNVLGLARHSTIYLDDDAAGHGWFVDPTPEANEEFERIGSGPALRASDRLAADRVDLLTVVEHEFGHVLGLEDLDALAENLMSRALEQGVRRHPDASTLDALMADYAT